MAVKAIPDGYHSVTPYLVVPGVAQLLNFLKQACEAQEVHPPMTRPDGAIMHAERLSGPLQEAVARGDIILREIPDT